MISCPGLVLPVRCCLQLEDLSCATVAVSQVEAFAGDACFSYAMRISGYHGVSMDAPCMHAEGLAP